ncbi:hypothetical protein [Herminiimonas sp. CN]|uniref:hypothetical protein n=1 Tax=Herminiimonas sp. CN TaxID=1349818 RepID=UPI0004737720|nr:hypothetical protein [Herminiimonas sp. CN]
MKKYLTIAASLIAGTTLMLAAVPGVAATVDINVVVPGVFVQPRPVYIQPQYENDWRERQLRALEWRDNPRNHGQAVSAAAHERNDARNAWRGKHHRKNKHDH